MLALHVDNLKECRACPWRYACGGGCPVMKLAPLAGVAKSPRAMEYGRRINCDLTRAVLEELLWEKADEVKTSVAQGPQPDSATLTERARFC
jgi:uncharacterized protein